MEGAKGQLGVDGGQNAVIHLLGPLGGNRQFLLLNGPTAQHFAHLRVLNKFSKFY